MLDPPSDQPLHQKIDICWLQSFTKRFQIVSRVRTGKHAASLAKQMEIEISSIAHLCGVRGLFDSKIVDGN